MGCGGRRDRFRRGGNQTLVFAGRSNRGIAPYQFPFEGGVFGFPCCGGCGCGFGDGYCWYL